MKKAVNPFLNKAEKGDENKNLDSLDLYGGDGAPAGLYQGASHG